MAMAAVGIFSRSVWSQASNPTHPATISEQVATEDRVRKPGWWPTKGTFPATAYVGNSTCAQCHSDLVAAQQRTSMAQTATRAARSELLRKFPLKYALGPYTYQAAQSADRSDYSVADRSNSFATTLKWAFGIRMGQSYLFEKNGGIFMAPLTYYPEAERWDFTVDQPHAVPDSLEKAVGRHLLDSEVRGCFNCHNTASTTSDRF